MDLHGEACHRHRLHLIVALQGGVRIEGLNKFIRNLEALGADVDDLKGAFSAIASEGARLASSFAPKRTGRLASSIRGNKSKNKAVVSAGKKSVPYAGAINYGWPRRNIQKSSFMQKADNVMQPRALVLLERNLDQVIRENRLG